MGRSLPFHSFGRLQATTNATGKADAPGTLVAWEEGIGDDKKYHIAHVSPEGITLVCKMKDYRQWVDAVAATKNAPAEAAANLKNMPKAVHFSSSEITKVTFALQLGQLTLFRQNRQKTKIPEGKEQAEVFAAIKQHLGGAESEEEADAWSVMKSPLFILALIAVIGGFFIYVTTICEPNLQATGRRAGMKVLLNWIGYTIGPVWMSLAVGALAALDLGMMSYQLVKRPIRQVLTMQN
jgi:hypothetical protein